jgi:hypothetical protein
VRAASHQREPMAHGQGAASHTTHRDAVAHG